MDASTTQILSVRVRSSATLWIDNVRQSSPPSSGRVRRDGVDAVPGGHFDIIRTPVDFPFAAAVRASPPPTRGEDSDSARNSGGPSIHFSPFVVTDDDATTSKVCVSGSAFGPSIQSSPSSPPSTVGAGSRRTFRRIRPDGDGAAVSVCSTAVDATSARDSTAEEALTLAVGEARRLGVVSPPSRWSTDVDVDDA